MKPVKQIRQSARLERCPRSNVAQETPSQGRCKASETQQSASMRCERERQQRWHPNMPDRRPPREAEPHEWRCLKHPKYEPKLILSEFHIKKGYHGQVRCRTSGNINPYRYPPRAKYRNDPNLQRKGLKVSAPTFNDKVTEYTKICIRRCGKSLH